MEIEIEIELPNLPFIGMWRFLNSQSSCCGAILEEHINGKEYCATCGEKA